MNKRLSVWLQLIRWDRPAGTLLLLWPTLSALWIASREESPGFPGGHLLFVFTLGTFLMRSAGCCINDVADRRFDKYVKRTAQRPVTSGAIPAAEALILGAVLALAAFTLVLTTSRTTVLYSFAAVAVTVAYPYTKRFFAMPQAVLGIAFSFGIPMAFAAVQQEVPALAWWLLIGNAFWVLAYDTEYAMVDRHDDLKLGIGSSAITLGRFDVMGVMLFYAIFLSVWGMVGSRLDLRWPYYAGLSLALVQVLRHYTLIRERSRDDCFRAFRLNHWVGFALFVGVVAEQLVL